MTEIKYQNNLSQNSLKEKNSSYNFYQIIIEQIPLFLKSLDIMESSKNTYRRQLKEFIIWQQNTAFQGELLTRENILDYKEYLREEQNLSSLTISGYLTAVRRFFEWLESVQIFPNIAKGIKGPKRRRGFKKDALTIEQVKAILTMLSTQKDLNSKRDFAMLNLMIRTGLRTIEITRALREDISRQGRETVLFIQGKGRESKDELIVLTDSTFLPIKEYFTERSNLGKLRESDPIFMSHSKQNFGKKLTTRSVSRIVKNRLKEFGIDDPRLTAHSLRHTAITFSLLAGATAQEARALARHSDINTTLIYAHNINRIDNAPEKKIDILLE